MFVLKLRRKSRSAEQEDTSPMKCTTEKLVEEDRKYRRKQGHNEENRELM